MIPTVSDTRAPWIMRESRSRPMRSVPRRYMGPSEWISLKSPPPSRDRNRTGYRRDGSVAYSSCSVTGFCVEVRPFT